MRIKIVKKITRYLNVNHDAFSFLKKYFLHFLGNHLNLKRTVRFDRFSRS
jgi:hypothetical protein